MQRGGILLFWADQASEAAVAAADDVTPEELVGVAPVAAVPGPV